jgi:hypothetical protein
LSFFGYVCLPCFCSSIYSVFQRSACILLVTILRIHYWLSCVSTVSISILGTTFLALSSILATFIGLIPTNGLKIEGFGIFFAALFAFLELVAPFAMIKAITRIEFRWKDATWIPVIRRASATHRERASIRLEARLSWYVLCGVSHCLNDHLFFYPLSIFTGLAYSRRSYLLSRP